MNIAYSRWGFVFLCSAQPPPFRRSGAVLRLRPVPHVLFKVPRVLFLVSLNASVLSWFKCVGHHSRKFNILPHISKWLATMAEVVGLTASIIQIAGAGVKLVRRSFNTRQYLRVSNFWIVHCALYLCRLRGTCWPRYLRHSRRCRSHRKCPGLRRERVQGGWRKMPSF